MSNEDEEPLERRSLADLRTIFQGGKKFGIGMLLIGGYAVAAYTRGYRYTKDIDLVADKPTMGRLRRLLRSLNYSVRETEFGIAGSKKIDDDFIDLHLSAGRVHDISTGKSYPIDSSLFKTARSLEVRGFYARDALVRIPVVDLETLVILKLTPVGRGKDAVDLVALLIDKAGEIDASLMVKRAEEAGLTSHLLDRVRDYAKRLREKSLEKIWFDVTGSRLSHTNRREIARFFSKVTDQLRQV